MNKFIHIVLLMLLFSPIRSYANQVDLKEIQQLYSSLSKSLDHPKDKFVYQHIVKCISEDGSLVTFENNLSFAISWFYQSVPQKWQEGDAVYISYSSFYSQIKLQHVQAKTVAWGKLKSHPNPSWSIKTIPIGSSNDIYSTFTLQNGYVFKSNQPKIFGKNGWKVKDRVIVLANADNLYQVWNIEKNQIIQGELYKNYNQFNGNVEIKDILSLKDRLNARVLHQPEATEALMTSLLNYAAGLKEQNQPIGVFLFIGPTGVGKTELAKVLADEMYGGSNQMLRLDMSHFSQSNSSIRLLGSPPGYINHEEGGQLTNPLSNNSQIIVLLDEMEKAHPEVIKTFLPIFDEGYILDTKNKRISCSETLFIMTSNLFSQKVTNLYKHGYSSEEILATIENDLIEALSPELYNRIQPILFRPIAKETMDTLVDVMLDKVINRLAEEKQIHIYIDQTLKSFLADKGYHELLGARPLKKLIEKRVLFTLAYTIIKEGIENGDEILLLYDKETDSVIVQKLASLPQTE